MADSLIKCWTAPGHGSDHVAILTSFDLAVTHHTPPPRRNFRGADWKEYPTLLDKHLVAHPLPPLPLRSREDIDAYTDALTRAIVTTLETHVPLARLSPFTNRWWCKLLSILRSAYNRAHR
ncbi:hypothetical protein DFH09DRAFT_933212, partial [Mycena vulgaris]